MKRILLMIGLIATLVGAGGVYAVAGGDPGQGPRHGRGHGGPGFLNPRILRQLELTEAQREQIRALFEAHRTTVEPLVEALRQQRVAIEPLILTTTFDEAQVRAAIASTADAELDLRVADARLMNQVYLVLTPEQRTELEQILANRPEKRDHGFDRGEP